MIHRTRCPWVKQNDADSVSHMPFLCGAAAAQMILYGRDDSRFAGPGSTQLATTAAVRRQDQAGIWQAIIAESQAAALPAGVQYDGTPEQDQVCEGAAFCWSTFPKALANALSHGVPLPSGPLAGVPATVRAVSSEVAIEDRIVASLDRGVAAALLIDGIHWVAVYRFDELDDGEASIFYRDGLLPKVQSNQPISLSAFESELSARPAGVFDGKYVAVTAATSVPVVTPQPPAIARPARAPRPQMTYPGGGRVPFPETLDEELREALARDPEWTVAFGPARTHVVLPVVLESGAGPGYYLADYVSPRDGGVVRTGSVVVDAASLASILIAGIDEPWQELPPIIGPEEARRVLDALIRDAAAGEYTGGATDPSCDDEGEEEEGGNPLVGLDPASLQIQGDMIWKMCDQSTSPFVPFYVVRGKDARTGQEKTLYLRGDGRWLGELTWKLAGI